MKNDNLNELESLKLEIKKMRKELTEMQFLVSQISGLLKMSMDNQIEIVNDFQTFQDSLNQIISVATGKNQNSLELPHFWKKDDDDVLN